MPQVFLPGVGGAWPIRCSVRVIQGAGLAPAPLFTLTRALTYHRAQRPVFCSPALLPIVLFSDQSENRLASDSVGHRTPAFVLFLTARGGRHPAERPGEP